jgi:hypothetical protein
MDLKEFFNPLIEGPRDPSFKPAPEIEVEPEAGALPPPEGGVDPAGAGGDPAMTQDVAKMSASSLQFFTKNVQSAVSKYNMQDEGFDDQALQQFAGAMDSLVFGMYQSVQDPAARQSFEADYQKVAADWAKDLTKLFDKVLKLKGHAGPY